MRRFALTLMASLSVLALAACSGYQGSLGGGTANTYDSLVFTEAGASADGLFLVAPTVGAGNPLLISVYGRKSSVSVVQMDAQATWAVTYGSTAQFYSTLQATQQPILKACPAVAAGAANPSAALVAPSGPPTAGYSTYAGGYFQTIGVAPAAIPAGPQAAPYCLNVVATTQQGVVGNVVVFVSN